jgi:hypothetical protein
MGLPNCLFLSGFLAEILYAFLNSHMHPTISSSYITVILIIFGEDTDYPKKN